VALSGSTRTSVERFAELVCPPELSDGRLMPALIERLELQLAAMPPLVSAALIAAFRAVDHGARLHRAARGRRLAALGRPRADGYIRALSGHGPRVRRDVVRLMKGLVVMSYYELPETRAQLGYEPDAYIADLARRRMETHGDEIRAADAAVLADEERP